MSYKNLVNNEAGIDENATSDASLQQPKWKSKTAKLFAVVGLAGGLAYAGYNQHNSSAAETVESEPQLARDVSVEPIELIEGQEEVMLMASHQDLQVDHRESSESLFSAEDMEAVNAISSPMSSLKRVVVGEAGNPHRIMLNHPHKPQSYWNNVANTMTFAGWKHHMGFLVYDKAVPGKTMRVAWGDAQGPHRAMLNHAQQNQAYWNNPANDMSYAGWQAQGDFHVLQRPETGAIRIAVAQAGDPHRMMLNHPFKNQHYWNQGHSHSQWGWSQFYQFWAFPDEITYDRLEYKLDMAKIGTAKPMKVFKQILRNKTTREQSFEITFQYTRTEKKEWQHHFGVTVGVSTEVSCGVPLLAEGKVSVSMETSYDYTTNKAVETSTQSAFKQAVIVPANSGVSASCFITESSMDVPYSIYFSSKWGKITEPLNGMWKGTSVSTAECNYDPIQI